MDTLNTNVAPTIVDTLTVPPVKGKVTEKARPKAKPGPSDLPHRQAWFLGSGRPTGTPG
jgi:hypothetical protein